MSAHTDTDPAWLEVKDIDVNYGTRAVVQGLSFRLARGEIGCLLGPSGCGKSTALRAIAGFEPVQRGHIHLSGRLVSSAGQHQPPEQRRIGMVFQDHALFPHLTVGQNVAFGIRGQADAADTVRALLERVELAHAASQYPHQLSGGQQQRVALARALAPRPALLLLDEPFSSLDVELRERLGLDVRRMLKEAGTTALLVTHDQHEAFVIADTVGVMHAGRVQQWDTPHRLYHQPRNRVVAGFVGDGSLLAGQLAPGGEVHTELGSARALDEDGRAPRHAAVDAVDTVDVLLRPDSTVLDAASPVRATVTHRAFRGTHYLCTLRLASGASLMHECATRAVPEVGNEVGLRLVALSLPVFAR